MRSFVLFAALATVGSASLFASVDRGLLAMVPADAKIVSSIDVTQARSSDFGQYLLSKTQNDNHDFADFVEQTGFDPRRDLQSLIFESAGPAVDRSQSRFAILARGTFDEDRIRTTAQAKGGTVETYEGIKLLIPPGNGHKTAVAFPEAGVAIMADLASMHEILGSRANPIVLDSTLGQQIERVADNNDAWFVSLLGGGKFLHGGFDQGAKQPAQAAQAAQALQSVLQSSGGIRFGSTVDLTVDAVARSPQDATSLADVIRFLASTVQMQREKDPKAAILASALDNMNLTSSGDSVHLAISIPEKNMEQLAELGPGAHRRGRR